MKQERFLLHAWVPLVLWISIIVLESTVGSSANTGALLQKLVRMLLGEIGPGSFEIFHFVTRKGGHFVGYGILGYLWFRAFLCMLDRRMPITSAALAISCSFLIAALDEWHQSSLPDRTGCVQDVALDTLGALVFISLAMVLVTRPAYDAERPQDGLLIGGEAVIDFHTTNAFMKKLHEHAKTAGCSLNAFIQCTLEKQLLEDEPQAPPKALTPDESDDPTIKTFLKALQDYDRDEREQQRAHSARRHAQEIEDREILINLFPKGAKPS